MSVYFVEVSKGTRCPDRQPRTPAVVETEISRIQVLADTDTEALLVASQIAGCTCEMALAARITEAIL